MSTEFIGTGEGAQAYGWGLYFAGEREVSEEYRRRLSNRVDFDPDRQRIGGKRLSDWFNYWMDRINNSRNAADSQEAIAAYTMLEDFARSEYNEKNVSRKGHDPKAVKWFNQYVKRYKVPEDMWGQLYEVDIPENDVLLDWDKPLSEQSGKIKKFLKGIKNLLPENALEDLGGDWDLLFGKDNTGQEFYDTLASLVGGDKAASLLLNKAGIPGLRYLDGNSRASGEGSHNYVIWDDAAVEILNTYYQSAGRDPRYAEQQAKFDALNPIDVTSAEVKTLRGGKDFTQRLIAWVESKGLFGAYDNADPRFTGVAFNAASVRSVKRHYAGDGKLAVLQAVPELIQNGIYLETTPRNEEGLQSHIFASRVFLDGKEYAVGFVIREDENGRRYFDHSLTNVSEMTTGLDAEATKPSRSPRTKPERMTAYEDVSTIVRKHLGVNPDFTLNSGQDTVRGQIGPAGLDDPRALVTLFRSKNVSTPIHELGHFFLNNLAEAAQLPGTPAWVAEALAGLQDTYGFTGFIIPREAHERFAREFEAYAREGKRRI
jgi:hypothetical protein